MPRQEQIAFVVELLRHEDSQNFQRNVKLLAKYLWTFHREMFEAAIRSLSDFELPASSDNLIELELTTLLSAIDRLSLKECADLIERVSLHLRQLAGLPAIAPLGALALIDSTPIATEGILGLTGDGNIAHANAVFSRLWQLPETLLLETQTDRLLLPYLAERVSDPDAFLAAVESDIQHPSQIRLHVVPLKTGQILERRSTPIYAKGQYSGRIIRYRDVTDMTAIARALRDSERQFRAFFDQNQIAMTINDLSGRYLRVNQAFCDLSGYSEIELLEMQVQTLSHPDDRTEEESLFEQMQRNEITAYTIEKRLLSRDGSFVWVQSFPCLVDDDAGNPLYVVTSLPDISEQKAQAQRREQAELALQRSEARYRAVVQDQTELICRFLPDTTLTFVNDAYVEYQGQGREQLLGKRWIDLLTPAEQESARAWLRDIFAEQKNAIDPAFRAKRQNIERLQVRRQVCWLQWTNRVVELDSDGNVVELQSVGQDITELKLTQDRLAEQEATLRSIIDSVPGAVYRGEHSLDWDDMFISEEIEDISGYPYEEFLPTGDRSFGSIVHEDDRQRVYDLEDVAVRAKQPFEFTYRILHRDGSIRWVLERGQGTYDSQGNLIWTTGVILDISEQKRQEEDLQRIIQNVPGAVYRVQNDNHWTMNYASDGIESFTGYSAYDFMNHCVYYADLVHPDDLDRLRVVGESNGQNRAFTIEYRIIHRDGSIRWVLEQGQGKVDATGVVIEWSGVIIPLSNRDSDTTASSR